MTTPYGIGIPPLISEDRIFNIHNKTLSTFVQRLNFRDIYDKRYRRKQK